MDEEKLGLQQEKQRLKKIIDVIKKHITKEQLRKDEIAKEIAEARADMRENSDHSIGNLWGSEAFEALAELSQFTNELNIKITDGEETVANIKRLENMLPSPYFARIDFIFEDDDELQEIYIGKRALKDEAGGERYIYDWRSPIAGVFYRFMPGKASYEAPAGNINGLITLKRQYEIEDGQLKYYFDSDIQVVDEFLRKTLSQNTSPQMKTIVETIQKEQDVVIRDMENDLMMVQGVAGSGKTSIALHRVAYLLYQEFTERLTSDNILIISPNSLFEQYIANVLPELGEENVGSVVLEEIAAKILKQRKVQSRAEFLEASVASDVENKIQKESMAFKNSRIFAKVLRRTRNLFKRRIARGDKIDAIAVYKRLFIDDEFWNKMCSGVSLPANINEIRSRTCESLLVKRVSYEDVAPLTYLQVIISGSIGYHDIKQVVIDEAQDYYPLQFELFKMLFSKAKFTILGDVNQSLEKSEDMSLYKRIQTILRKRNASLVTLNKSFRCTKEILMFSSKFLQKDSEIESFNRQGQVPTITSLKDEESLATEIVYKTKECQARGFSSIGLICKTQDNAKALFGQLKNKIDIHLVDSDNDDTRGIFIIPIYMAKGLEFDAVLICDADSKTYCREIDKNLLYIATTRALHQLDLFCVGELSPFINKNH